MLLSDALRENQGVIGDLETDIGLASCTVALCNSSMKESSDRYSASEFSALTCRGSSIARRFSFVSYQLCLLFVGIITDSLFRFLNCVSSNGEVLPDGTKSIDSRFDRRRALGSSGTTGIVNPAVASSLARIVSSEDCPSSDGGVEGLGWIKDGIGVLSSGTIVGTLSTDCPSSAASELELSCLSSDSEASFITGVSSSDIEDGRVDGAPDDP
jgi:hypothetical protein